VKSLIRTSGFAAMVVAGGLACTSTAGAATSARAACKEDRVATADGCQSPRAVTRRLQRIVRKASDHYGLKAVVARVDIGRRTLLRQATGRSQADVPADLRMHFRVGSMAIPWLTTLALQLQQEGRLSFDDKLSRWFPELPRADRITIRMLAYNTSGYYDYFQGNQAFIDRFHSDVFKRWRQSELLDIALARGFVCDPGTCFSYAHTNFIVLGMIIAKVTGQSTSRQMTTRILRPLGLDETRITSKATIPAPVLHAFTSERGVYEDSTTWSPSWTVGDGMIATSTIDDIAKAGRAIFSGRLLSRRSYRELVANSEIAPSTPAVHYGLGLLVANGWLIQNPALNGYSGILAYLPAAKLSVALTVTSTQPGSLIPANANEALFARMAAYLSPENRPPYEP
jgi:D-alanyl-D-alanine carboxypeptidase